MWHSYMWASPMWAGEMWHPASIAAVGSGVFVMWIMDD